jgi:DNA-binding transcriptional ArsR family regulator
MNSEMAKTAALLSDPGRAGMMLALMGGVALPAGQLAMIANVAPQTASSHLSQLLAGRLLRVERQGRHRYYRLASEEVAHAVEALTAIAHHGSETPTRLGSGPGQAPRPVRAPVGTMAFARTCYSHLAGLLGVEIAGALQKREYLIPMKKRLFAITPRGRTWFQDLRIPISDAEMHSLRFARQCLDWTERRHHLAGQLGSALLKRLMELKWVVPIRDSRAVRVTQEGERALRKCLGIDLPRA